MSLCFISQKQIAPARLALRRIPLLSLAFTAGLSCFTAQTALAATPVPATAAVPTQTPPFNGIAHIAIRVEDIAASVAFYNKLGFQQAFSMTGKDGKVSQAFMKIDDRQFIELYPVNAHDPKQNTPSFLHLCFEGADLNAIHDFYVAEGLTPISVRKAGAGNLLFTLKGPQQPDFPQNIEYTQYMPESMHTKDFGQHLGLDRVADKMTVVALAMQDPAAAREFYLTKMGFTADPAAPNRLNLPGASGQQIEIVPADQLGAKSSIVLTTPNLDKAAAQLTRQQVAFQRATSTQTDATGKTRSIETISVADPDGNIVRIVTSTPHESLHSALPL